MFFICRLVWFPYNSQVNFHAFKYINNLSQTLYKRYVRVKFIETTFKNAYYRRVALNMLQSCGEVCL